MADNTVTASGPTRGTSYVLPWDAMAQYDQMVQTSKNQYEQQNQQRLATIADMEKQDLTGMPSYDKALEDYYEQLHGEMGKIITKYRDPFQSLEGMRELKGVQAKYIANPIVNNAKTTETSFKSMQADLANNIITKEDYDIRKAEYDKHITEGDVTKPFIYQQPNYIDPTTVVAQIASSFDTEFKEDANKVVSGHFDEQIGNIYDAAFIDKSRDRFLLGVDNYAATKGYGKITDEETRKKIGMEYIRMMLPLKTDLKERTGGGDGLGSGKAVQDLRTWYDTNRGTLDPNNANSYIDKNADGSLRLSMIGHGINQGAYSWEPTESAKIKFIKSDNYDPGSKQLNSTVVMSKAELYSGVGNKIAKQVKALGINDQVFSGTSSDGKSSINGITLTERQFDILGESLGFTFEQIDKINKDYVNGNYTDALSQSGIYDDVLLKPDGQAFSPSAFLYHIISKKARIANDNDKWTPDDVQELETIYKINKKSDAVYLHGVQLNAQMDTKKDNKVNDEYNTGTVEAQKKWSSIFQQTDTPRREILGGGLVLALSDNGRYYGFTDVNRVDAAGRNNLAEVFLSKNTRLSDAALFYYQQQKRITQRYTQPNQPSVLQLFFKGLDKEAIRKHLTFAPEGQLSTYQMAEQIKAELPEMTKNGETTSEKEKMILDLCQEFDNMEDFEPTTFFTDEYKKTLQKQVPVTKRKKYWNIFGE